MRKEYEIIQLIQDVKQQAINLHPNELLKQPIAARDFIKKHYNKQVSHKDISELWDAKLALAGLNTKQGEPRFSPGVQTDALISYNGKSIVEISIKKQKVIKVSGCAGLKKAVITLSCLNKRSLLQKTITCRLAFMRNQRN